MRVECDYKVKESWNATYYEKGAVSVGCPAVHEWGVINKGCPALQERRKERRKVGIALCIFNILVKAATAAGTQKLRNVVFENDGFIFLV